ncbi:MAG: hypothetical protein P8Y60_14345, partial [Calditrichota bacterium]
MTTDLPYETWFWVGFILLILILLAVDLGFFHRSAHRIGLKESLIWTGAWVGLALIFGGVIWLYGDMNSLLQYLSGYLIEESLSMDNLFVFLIIFSYFSIPEKFRYTVLFWGIIGALVFRGLFIFAGVELLRQFHWVLYILGGFLVYTGIRMALRKGEEVEPEKNPVLKFARK